MSNFEVIALAGWPPEVLAYAIAKYSRSSSSIRESLVAITSEQSVGFFDRMYFGYGHKSIADNAHVPLAFEGISQIAAFELEDESLWDGQERSTRYQDFAGKGNFEYFVPRSVRGTDIETEYRKIAEHLLKEYRFFSAEIFEHLVRQNPKPADMKDDQYERALRARAFDVARYFLFGAIKTNVGQITSARTLEEQITRLMSSEYPELHELGEAMKKACAEKPFSPEGREEPPVAPTLLKYTAARESVFAYRKMMREFAAFHFKGQLPVDARYVELVPETSIEEEIVATMLFEVTQLPYREILHTVQKMHPLWRDKFFHNVFRLRGDHDPLARAFMSGYKIIYEIVMDRGGQRDMHRHRRCIQIHQQLSTARGYDVPTLVHQAGLENRYREGMDLVRRSRFLWNALGVDANYLIPFAYRTGMLMKMDVAEALYITELRSGVGGHFSYREVANQMYEALLDRNPCLGWHREIPKSDGRPRVTPFETEDLLKR